MAARAVVSSWPLVPLAASMLLVGCAQTPMGPTVAVMPGPGKNFDAFQTDVAVCKNFAAGQVQGQAEAANQQAIGTTVLATALGAGLGAVGGSLGGNAGAGAAAGAAIGAGTGTAFGAGGSANAQVGIQYQYDNSFSQCMYSKGDQVPGYAPVASAPQPGYSGGPDPALVRSVQSELIRLRYLNDVADGAAGPHTVSAIRGFERATGLPVDGTPTEALLARLQSTPSSQSASSGSTGWVAPTQAATPVSTPAAASTQGTWVAPTQ